MNIYLICVASLETGDVDIFKNVYSSFGDAIKNIEEVIKEYLNDRNFDKSYKIVQKDDFNLKLLNKDSTLKVGSYCFKKKKSSVCIYKKVVVTGTLWNGEKFIKVGKISVLPEININYDNKCKKTAKTIIQRKKSVSNYEHGQHVSFIHELKRKLKPTDNTNDIIEKSLIKHNFNKDHENFITSLSKTKTNLSRITPPPSPDFGLGRVVTTQFFNQTPNSIDGEIIQTPKVFNQTPNSIDGEIIQMIDEIILSINNLK